MASLLAVVLLITLFNMSKAELTVDELDLKIQDLTDQLIGIRLTNLDNMNNVQSSIGFLQTTIGSLQNGVCSVPQQQNISSLPDDVASMQDQIDSLRNQLGSANSTDQRIRESESSGGNVEQGEFEAFDVILARIPSKSTIPVNTIVKFNREFVNVHNGYDLETGYYTAPIAGLYNMLLTGRAAGGSVTLKMWFEDGDNGATRTLCFIHTDYHRSASCGAVVNMKQGDKVYVKTFWNTVGSISASEEYGDTKFSGFMIRCN